MGRREKTPRERWIDQNWEDYASHEGAPNNSYAVASRRAGDAYDRMHRRTNRLAKLIKRMETKLATRRSAGGESVKVGLDDLEALIDAAKP